MANPDYDADVRDYDDDRREFDRDRSRSPRAGGNDSGVRPRSASPNGRDRYDMSMSDAPGSENKDDQSVNPGSNLFVTGIAPRVTEEDMTRLFADYGEVASCNIMRDPHSGESRGFGFVRMVSAEAADAAREALTGKVHDGRTLSIEKARRGRPRTPTPGKYYGPPKRADFRSGRGGRRFEPYDDRRRGYGGGRRDEYAYRGSGYRDRYDDRYGPGEYGGSYGGGRSFRDREDYPPRDRGDRYASGPPREDRYGGPPREDRYGGPPREDRYSGPPRGGDDRRSGGYYPREDRAGGPRSGFDERGPAGYPEAPPRDAREPYPPAGARSGYDDREPKRV